MGIVTWGMLLLFVDLELSRSKFITQVLEEVTRDFSSLPFNSVIYICVYDTQKYIHLCKLFLLGFNMLRSAQNLCAVKMKQ